MANPEPLVAWNTEAVREQLEALGCRVDKASVYPPPDGHWRYDPPHNNRAHLVIKGGPFQPGGSEPVTYIDRWKSAEWIINGKSYVKVYP